MSTSRITRKSATKNLRFPHKLVEHIRNAVQEDKSGNFTSWIIDACWLKLQAQYNRQLLDGPIIDKERSILLNEFPIQKHSARPMKFHLEKIMHRLKNKEVVKNK